MGFSYGYNRTENVDDYHTGRELIMMLIDIVSRGGNLLLDIGPTGDGRIPVVMEERLLQMGELAEAQRRGHLRHAAVAASAAVEQGQSRNSKQKEFMADYKINNMVDTPPGGLRPRGRVLHREERRGVCDPAAAAGEGGRDRRHGSAQARPGDAPRRRPAPECHQVR